MTDSTDRPDRNAPQGEGTQGGPQGREPDLSSYWMVLDDLEIHREELRQRAMELSEAQSTLEAIEELLAEAPLGYVILDASGIIRECNYTAAKMLGLHPRSVTGWALSAFAVPDHKRRLLDHLLKARKTTTPVKIEVALQSRSGALLPCQLVTRQAQSPDAFRTAILDLTDRRRIETALQTTERRLSAAVEASGAGIFELEIPFEGVLYLSHSLAQMLGYTRSELAEPAALPKWFQDRLHPEDASDLKRSYGEFAAGASLSYQGDVRFLHRDEKWRWMRVWAKGTTSESAISVVGVVMDVTAEKERNLETERRAQQLRALATELYQVEERERRELAMELHDNLAQMIVATKMKLGVIGSIRDATALQHQLEGTMDLLDRANDMVRSLTMNLSPPILDELGLGPAVTWLAKDIEKQFGLQVHVEERGEIGFQDPRIRFMLFRSIRELLINTAKHAGTGRAWVMLQPEPNGMRVVVEDHGEGFDLSEIRAVGSHGFGLFSIQERVQSSGGEMRIRSAPGQGTTIVLRMPSLEEAAPRMDAAPVASDGTSPPLPQRIRVLLADDHELVRSSLARLLDAQRDLEVIGEASDGESAIELARLLDPDVILMDVTMSGVGGIEATRRISEERPDSRVVGLSMHLSDDVASAMKKAGAFEYLPKSSPAHLLFETIRKAAVDARSSAS